MWLDQDLLAAKEDQRRGGVAVPRTITTSSTTAAGTNFQLAGTGAEKTDQKSSQAYGYAKGFSSGWAAGQKRANREAQQERQVISEQARLAEEARSEAYVDAMDEIQAIADAVASRDNLVIDEMKSALMEAAVTLAEALLGVELSEAETGAKAALKRALSMNDPKEIVSVHLNPQDVVTLHNLGVESPVELVPDKELDPGDVHARRPVGCPAVFGDTPRPRSPGTRQGRRRISQSANQKPAKSQPKNNPKNSLRIKERGSNGSAFIPGFPRSLECDPSPARWRGRIRRGVVGAGSRFAVFGGRGRVVG